MASELPGWAANAFPRRERGPRKDHVQQALDACRLVASRPEDRDAQLEAVWACNRIGLSYMRMVDAAYLQTMDWQLATLRVFQALQVGYDRLFA